METLTALGCSRDLKTLKTAVIQEKLIKQKYDKFGEIDTKHI